MAEAGADELYCGVKEPDAGSVYLSNFMSEAASANCNFHAWFLYNVRRTDATAAWSSLAERICQCHQGLPVSVYGKRRSGWTSVGPARRYPPRGFRGPNCVFCALWHLHRWKVPFVKICGRPNPVMGCDCGAKRCFYPEIRSTRDHGARLAK